MTDSDPLSQAVSTLSDRFASELARDGEIRLDRYLALVQEVASGHGVEQAALVEAFGEGPGADYRVTLSPPASAPGGV